jgi:hypothetical protein
MRSSRKLTPWVAAVACFTCTHVNACHVTIHYTKAQIEAAHVRLYEQDVRVQALDPTNFDLKHPQIGQMLSSQQYYEQELLAWKSKPERFEHENPALWHVLDGDMLFHKRHPFQPSIISVPTGWLPPGNPGAMPTGGGQPGGGIFDPGIQPAGVPEPSSVILGLTAVIMSVVAVISRWRSR